MGTKQIVIIGFMGTGKTTVAQELARQLDRQVVDLDTVITQRELRGPKEIIEQDGENSFREIEAKLLREVLLAGDTCVIAVGGGAWTIAENRKLIAEQRALTVWLDAPFELCWKRISHGPEARPLAPSYEIAAKLYNVRRPLYELADSRITVSEHERVEDIAAKVAAAVARLDEQD